jgi:RHS repeat-associated protein
LHYYFDGWSVVEVRLASDVVERNYWSPLYVDGLIMRYRSAGGSTEEKLFAQNDAKWNVTSLADSSGAIAERVTYTPYGQATFRDASWSEQSSSAYAWTILHQGGRYEADTGLYHFRHRDLSVPLGRWTRTDPIGFAAGDQNLYRYVGGNPGNALDPLGLAGC